MAEDWLADVRKYAADADEAVVAKIVRYCGISLRNPDSSLVSFSDPKETQRVRDNFLKKKLGLTAPDETLDAGVAKVGEQMKGDRTKNRVTVYYLLSEYFDSLDLFGGTKHGRVGGLATAAAGAAAVAASAPKASAPPPPPPPPISDTGSGTAAAGAGAATGAQALGGFDNDRGGDTGKGAGGTGDGDTGKGGGGDGGPHTDGGGEDSNFKWWPWLLLAGGLLLLFLLLRSCQPTAAPLGPDMNMSTDAPMNMDAGMDTDLGNGMAAAPVAAPVGAAVIAETRAGLPALNVYFDTGKSAVHNDLATASAAVKAYADANPGATLAVSGFNDPTGNAAANAELSKNRAQAVKAALEKAGIAPDRIVLEKPAETTATDADAAQARRVEVTVKQ